MRFKDFIESGLFGNVRDQGGEGLVSHLLIKQVKSPAAATPSNFGGPKITKPARPAGIISHNKPNTIKSHLI